MQSHTTELNTEKEQAEVMKISVRHLTHLRARRLIPFIRLGKSIRYDPVAVQRALEKLSVKER